MMYLSLIIITMLLLGIAITSLQNSVPLGLKFIAWDHQMSLTALILYSSLIGGIIVGVLALPRLAKKSLYARRLNKEIYKLKERISELEKDHVGGVQAE